MIRNLLILLAMLCSFASHAKETVTIVYAFGPSDTMANYSRTLVAEANRIQNKYTFVFDTKPGGGSTVATNYARNTPNTILATASPFWIRPIFYPESSFNTADFRGLLSQCDSPIAVTSKYRSWNEVPSDRPLTIGTSGLGVTTHLVALQLAKKYPNMQVVPFKSTSEAILATASGHTDFAVGFVNDSLQWTGKDVDPNKRLYILGVTGDRVLKNLVPLSQQGFSIILGSMNVPHHLVIASSMADSRVKELRNILFRAAQAPAVQQSCLSDLGTPLNNMDDPQLKNWYMKQQEKWQIISQGIKIQ